MDWKEKAGGLKGIAPVLSAVVVTACIGVGLAGYKAPVFAAKEDAKEASKDTADNKKKTEEKKTETKAKGSFNLPDGVYQGSGTGFSGTVTVAVQIKDKQITSIDILSNSDDAAFFNRAKGVIDRIISAQSLDVDVVSGATYSSNGIISAVKNALTGEKDSGETGESQSGGTAAAGSSTSVGQVADAAAYKDGTYYGTGTGFGGAVRAEVVISGGKISSIQILENNEGSQYLSKASALIDNIISSQSTNVDTVSGATYSSVGIIQAVRDALSQAAVTDTGSGSGTTDNGQNSGQNGNSGESQITGTVPYTEGIYYGTAEGYSGDVTVAVVIQDQTIKAILVTETQDDQTFFNRAMDVVKNVVKKQSTDVDIVSGATYSSNGLINAIKNALAEAEKVTNGETTDEPQQTVDTSQLSAAIQTAKSFVGDEYTEGSWAVLEIRIQDAQEAMTSGDQKEVDKALSRLNTAIRKLLKKDSGGEDTTTVYLDGTYTVTVTCSPDEDEDFQPYNLTLDMTVLQDKIVDIQNVAGDGSEDNASYLKKAIEGTSKQKGVVTQILEKGNTDGIDTVSRATCSSKAILDACNQALEQAKRPADEGTGGTVENGSADTTTEEIVQ